MSKRTEPAKHETALAHVETQVTQARRNGGGARGANKSSRAPICMGSSLGHRLTWASPFDSFLPSFSRAYISHKVQVAISSNHILLVYIAYLTSVVSYQCPKKILLHFVKGTFAPPALLNERQEGRLLPSAPLLGTTSHANFSVAWPQKCEAWELDNFVTL